MVGQHEQGSIQRPIQHATFYSWLNQDPSTDSVSLPLQTRCTEQHSTALPAAPSDRLTMHLGPTYASVILASVQPSYCRTLNYSTECKSKKYAGKTSCKDIKEEISKKSIYLQRRKNTLLLRVPWLWGKTYGFPYTIFKCTYNWSCNVLVNIYWTGVI